MTLAWQSQHYHGSDVAVQWHCQGNTMAVPWQYNGRAMAVPWKGHSAST